MMHALPKVSVITGFYNRGRLLARTLDSLLAQTYPNLEIIVFDDCSTDDTSKRLEAYEARNDPRLRVIRHERNIGFTAGMIGAIAQAEGEFIAVQGSGDASSPTRIARQAEVLAARPDVGVVGCYYRNVVEESGIYRVRTPDASKLTYAKLLAGKNSFSHGEVMYRKDLYLRVGGYRTAFRFCQDADLWIRLRKHCKFETVDEVLYDRYILPDGFSYKPEKAVQQICYTVLCRRIEKMPVAEQQVAIAKLESEGLKSVISYQDPSVQRIIVRNCLRQVVWGDGDQARELAGFIQRGWRRTGVERVANAFADRRFSRLRDFTLFALGINPIGR